LSLVLSKRRIEWNDCAELSALSGKAIRFRFHLTNGRLFAFWVTPDPNRAVNGYVAAGGEGVHEIGGSVKRTGRCQK
jgi:hypothetical protein